MRRSVLVALILGLFSVICLVASCGGDGGGQENQDLSSDNGSPDVGPPDTSVDQVDEPEVPCVPDWVLEFFAVEDGMNIETLRVYAVKARIYDKSSLSYVQGEDVTFSVSGAGDASFVQTVGTTDEFGVASVEFDAGTEDGVEYTITISHRCFDPMSIKVKTVPPQKGKFIITVNIDPELSNMFDPLNVTLYLNNVIPMCGAFNYVEPSGIPLAFQVGQGPVEFPDAIAGTGYLVTGVALNNKGLPVGGGCVEGVAVLPDRTEEVTVNIGLLDLNPVGVYEVTMSGNLYEHLPESLVDPGKRFVEFLQAAPQSITQRIVDDLLMFFPEGLPVECNGNQVDIPAEILASIELGLGASFPPSPWSSLGEESGQILADLLGGVTLNGSLTVQDDPESDRYSVKLHITQITLAGDLPCGEECSDLKVIPFDQFTGGEVVLELEDLESMLGTDQFDKWSIGDVQFTLRPGKLFMLAFVRTILPAYGLPDSIEEVLQPMFNCTSLVAGVSFQTTTCLNKNLQSLADSCSAAVKDIRLDFYAEYADMLAEQFLSGSFSGEMKDTDSNLTADSLQGAFDGEFMLTTGGTQASQGTVSLTFEAEKTGE